MKIIVGMPVLETVKAETMVSTINMLASTRGHELHFIPAIGTTVIHDARNHIVKEAYSVGFDAILFIDSDMIFPADTLNKIISSEKDIVGVRYLNTVTRKVNAFSYIKEKNTFVKISIPKNEGLVEVDAVGAGILFVKRLVFDKVRSPYFFYDINFGEDVNFCYRAKLAGFNIYVETDLEIGHIGKAIYK